MKHGKYLVFSILYSNLLLNEACKRGWSSILKGSQQGTVAVRENLKEKIFLVLIMKKEANKMSIVFMARMRIVIYIYYRLRKLEIKNLAK